MLNKVSKENEIGFLETDYEKLDQEVKAINDKYNTKEEKPTRIAKQTSGNIYKQRSLVNFLEENSVPQPLKIAEKVISAEKYKKLGQPDINSAKGTSSQVVSAHTEGITDVGGPAKYIKSQTGNSIFDPNNLERQITELQDNKENTKKEKEHIASNRRIAEQQRMDELAEALKTTDLRKDSQVISIATNEGHTYKEPPISIFDDNREFSRIPDKTEGEKIIERSKKERLASKKHPYVNNKKTTSSLFDSLFDKLQQKREKK